MTQKEFASLGGRARAKALTKDRRKEIAKLAGQASALQRQLASKKETCQSDESSGNKV
jgi:general stress protein YciG